MSMKKQQKKNYYEILEVPPTASQLDIKKAYRRLALIHHPDRRRSTSNSAVVGNNEDGDDGDNNAETTAKETFQLIGEAYNCLSDPVRRRDYNNELKWSSPSAATAAAAAATTTRTRSSARTSFDPSTRGSGWQQRVTPTRVSPWIFSPSQPFRNGNININDDPFFVDAFQQFDFLFHEDPFFKEGFRDIDDEFARRFYNDNNENEEVMKTNTSKAKTDSDNDQMKNQDGQVPSANAADHGPPTNNASGWMPSWLRKILQPEEKSTPSSTTNTAKNTKEDWIPWLLRQLCGMDFQITTYTSNSRGGVTTTNYRSSSRRDKRNTSVVGHSGYNHQSRRRDQVVPSYTQTSMSSYIDRHGRQVTVQSKEVDGNRIEDTRINRVLVQRKVNGVTVAVHQDNTSRSCLSSLNENKNEATL
jgi:curved DNA-binding protein CbpA